MTPAEQDAAAPTNMAVTVSAQYVKDFSFESPNVPQIFASLATPPEMAMGVNLQTRALASNSYEVALSLKLDAKLEGKTAFIAELVYAGVFGVPALPEDHLKFFLMVEAPRLLFPFAREILMTSIRDGGFPHVMINPIDFLALYVSNQNNIGNLPAAGAA